MDILDSLLGSQDSPPTADERHWSVMQEAIFDQVRNSGENLLIQARAGTGKTTTIVKGMDCATGTSLFLAFNKAISEDIKKKVNINNPYATAEVKTLNGLGHGMWWRNSRSSELDALKVKGLVRQLVGEGTEDYKEFGYAIGRAAGLAKNCAFGLETKPFHSDFTQLIDSYGFDIPEAKLDWAGTIVQEVFERSRKDLKTFDFDDQLYIPLQENWKFPYYSNVFVDECQDLSPIQHLMLRRLQAQGSRIIAVGDSHQAIYGFRGALVDSMNTLKDLFQMTELPLSISYRCAESIIAAAQQYCLDIQARPGAPQGQVIRLNRDLGDKEPEIFSNVLVLCRNNAPMFKAILRHVRAKSPCIVLTNFLESFQGFIRSFKTTRTSELRTKLDQWLEKERASAEKRGFKNKVAQLMDKYDTAVLLSNEFQFTEDVIKLLTKLGQGTTGPTFATIHKAKGLEHENVYILGPDLMPSPYATTLDAKQQEANLIYVAITRAKLKLTWGLNIY